MVVLSLAPFALASTAGSVNLPDDGTVIVEEEPTITARVARISFMRGEAQIKRSDVDDWEKASLNLPLVEGDMISTAAGSRIEIQFDTKTHLRLDETAFVKILKLRNEGIALSISEGTASLRIIEFDKDRGYFEIDAPSTTIAIQKAGMYRFDAGRAGDHEIRLSALDAGEARVYSQDSGFTLKSGRSVRVFIAGDRLGEWDTDKAATIADAFDTWALERDEAIARRLKDAHYDTYYDRDIYAADELTENGSWIHTKKYGYVWRPHRQATSYYADWSPYRYGTWRWVPYYGWTWVNDEPWGWATYHHGRWFYDSGYWHWSPYGYYRHSRSWWRPALVVFSWYGNAYCWYPLPYHYAYYNYSNYTVINNTTIINNYGVTPTPTPGVVAPSDANNIAKPRRLPPIESVPPSAVVAIDKSEFGRGTQAKRAPLAAAQEILTKVPDEKQIAIKLPVIKDLNGQLNSTIKGSTPPLLDQAKKTGAAVRTNDAPLDNTLRNERMLGNRPPVKQAPAGVAPNDTRRTGAVDRPSEPVKNSEIRAPQTVDRTRETPTYNAPVTQPRERERPREQAPPIRQEPPRERERPREQPPVRQPTPRYDPPPVRQPDPPREKPRDNPPPVKSEPKPDSKPAPLQQGPDRKKDS